MAQATPPRPPRTPAVDSPSQPTAGPSGTNGVSSDLWTEILRSADRQLGLAQKNVVLLAERHRGQTHLLDKLAGKRRNKRPGPALAIGYDVLRTDDRDEDAPPPVSVLYPPSSHASLVKLLDVSLPPRPLSNTAVVIVLDWSKPSSMVRELLHWLGWVDAWMERTAKRDGEDSNELRERLQHHLQQYSEPTGAANTAYNTLLPLGPGTLTRNTAGVPIIVVCTRADLMDAVGDEMGMKGGGWEERTDWIQQILRTVCLSYGAALFYTAPTQPKTYTLLKDYIFHRLYSPVERGDKASSVPSRFPFPHRANVLDRDAVMVPSGWDSFGKINVLREGFDPARVQKAWEASAARLVPTESQPDVLESEDDSEGIEDLWVAMVPDMDKPKAAAGGAVTTTSEGEQAFLQKHLDVLLKDPNRDARAAFRHAAASATTASEERGEQRGPGVVGPMGVGGLNLPGVEKAMAEMEGEERLAKAPGSARRDAKPTSPTPDRNSGTNEALHNFFQGLLAKKQGGSTTNTPTKSK